MKIIYLFVYGYHRIMRRLHRVKGPYQNQYFARHHQKMKEYKIKLGANDEKD